MNNEISQVNFRMPSALKERLEREAKSNGRTLTAEIVYRLQTTLEMDEYDLHLAIRPEEQGVLAAIKKDLRRLLERVEKRSDEE